MTPELLVEYGQWFPTLIHAYSMEQCLTGEANRFSATQEIPHILWKPKPHYRVYKCPL